MADKRAVFYLRISLDSRGDGLAIERQRDGCQKKAAALGLDVVGEYVDQSISASGDKDRPGYNAMEKAFEAGEFSTIVCYDIDRLSRRPGQLEQWLERAERGGLNIVTADNEVNLSTDYGRLFVRIKAALARQEVETMSRRRSYAQKQRARKGNPPSGVRPFGYDSERVIIEEEAALVRAMYAAFLKGHSLRDIARALDGDSDVDGLKKCPRPSHTITRERNEVRAREGRAALKVPEPYGWGPTTVRRILRNPIYAGMVTYRATGMSARRDGVTYSTRDSKTTDAIVRDDDGSPIRGKWDPIIAADDWWAVQAVLDDPRRLSSYTGSRERRRLGAGLFRCYDCDVPLKNHGPRYRCDKCGMVRQRGSVDDFVLDVISAYLSREDVLKGLRKAAASLSSDDGSNAAAGRVEALMRRLETFAADYADGVITGREYAAARDKVEAEIAAETKKAAATTTGRVLDAVIHPGADFKKADLLSKRAIIDAVCVVHLRRGEKGNNHFQPDSVIITWR
ncbi:recombinase family protein [Corynebacterium minutissimum]|uniref:DNA recombinase n=1 Tax=Corynebacterium minutissimum TaxID=38301 RepID=A0A376CWC1_9CORY|nr:recombinase family protein [Corynebacterium minutissimum]QRP60685.1 recombinase family protein [Corynebacterium minutissimum]STC76811.1 DNA recombinase [Corynebacterium minutissimum]